MRYLHFGGADSLVSLDICLSLVQDVVTYLDLCSSKLIPQELFLSHSVRHMVSLTSISTSYLMQNMIIPTAFFFLLEDDLLYSNSNSNTQFLHYICTAESYRII